VSQRTPRDKNIMTKQVITGVLGTGPDAGSSVARQLLDFELFWTHLHDWSSLFLHHDNRIRRLSVSLHPPTPYCITVSV
jgi:hypothetical protein